MAEKNVAKAESLKEKTARYRALTEAALLKVSVKAFKGTRDFVRANDFLSMAENYLSDGRHFEEKGETALALAAYSYAHAWLDAGVRAGFLDGKNDDKLFTLP